MDKLIKPLVDSEVITPAQGRSIEIFLLWVLVSLCTWILDWVTTTISGQEFSYKLFLSTFATTTLLSVVAWVKKYIRDMQKR